MVRPLTMFNVKCVFIIDCLREEQHPSHMCLRESLETIQQVQPKQAFLTHCSHEMNCIELGPHLPEGVAFSFDTQQLHF